MHRLAVFVEGYTEMVFVEKLMEEIAGCNKVVIEKREVRGGRTTPRSVRLISATKPLTGQQYYMLLMDCGGDNAVKTRIREEHANLTQAGYTHIVGLRDVRPIVHADIPKLEASLPRYVNPTLAPVTFILAILELEAWFLAEWTHFPRIDAAITTAAIHARLGFDPEHDDMAQRLCPVEDLRACYALGGKAYVKGRAQVTVNALDYALLYTALRSKITYLDRLVTIIDAFLAL